MLVEIGCHRTCKPLQLISHYLDLLGREIDVNREARLSAVFNAKLLNTLLDRVLRVHEVDDLGA